MIERLYMRSDICRNDVVIFFKYVYKFKSKLEQRAKFWLNMDDVDVTTGCENSSK